MQFPHRFCFLFLFSFRCRATHPCEGLDRHRRRHGPQSRVLPARIAAPLLSRTSLVGWFVYLGRCLFVFVLCLLESFGVGALLLGIFFWLTSSISDCNCGVLQAIYVVDISASLLSIAQVMRIEDLE